MTADPAFRGDASRFNPEQLLVAAASSCQMLSFLGAAARAGADVLAYEDTATSRLLVHEEPARLDAIHLEVAVRVAAGVTDPAVQVLAQQAHDQCFIANSLGIPVDLTVRVHPA